MVASVKNLPGTSLKKGKGKVLTKGLTGIFALKAIRIVKQVLKYNLTKKHHTWDCGCLGSTVRFFETQL